jgi:threonine synthase
VGWAGLQRYLADESQDDGALCISLETAHPAKFPEEIEANLGIVPETPPSLEGLEQRPEEYPVISTNYGPFRDMLLERYGQ